MAWQDLSLMARPGDLALRWNQLFKQTFPWMGKVDQSWAEWLKDNVPSDAQVLRKLLLDLLPEFEAARHQGEEFNTLGGWVRNKGFNDYVSRPIQSRSDYAALVTPVVTVLHFSKVGTPPDVIAHAVFRFLLIGDGH